MPIPLERNGQETMKNLSNYNQSQGPKRLKPIMKLRIKKKSREFLIHSPYGYLVQAAGSYGR